jgi:hypothetical protein
VVAALLALLLAGASAASAHTGPLVTVAPNQALPGAQVTVSVGGVPVSDTELRWATVDGPLLAVAAAPGMRATITVPADAPADVVYIRAVQNGQLVASGPIEVLAPAPSPAAAGAPADSAQTPASAVADAAATGAPQVAARPAASSSAAASTKPARASSPVASTAPDHSRAAAPKRTAVAATPARRSARAEPSATRGTRSAVTAARDAQRTPVTRAARTPDSPAARSAGRPAPSRAAPTVAQAGPAVPRPHADEADRRLGIGAAMLALGLASSLGGFAVADVRRRRARSRA